MKINNFRRAAGCGVMIEFYWKCPGEMSNVQAMKFLNGKNHAAKGKRYTLAEKQAVLEHVEAVNAQKGRGGIAAAARAFGITPLTISNWLQQGSVPPVGGDVTISARDFQRLAEVHGLILEAERALEELRREYVELRAKL